MRSLAHTLKVWEDVLAMLRRKSVSWQGNPLSERDLHTFTEAIVMCAIHLTDMSTRHGGIGSERELIAWAHSCVTLDVHVLGSFLSDAITLLRNVASRKSYSWFKRQLAGTYPFVGWFLAPMKRSFSSFLDEPNPVDFRECYQFLSFLTHLSLLDLAVDLEDEYVELESYLHGLTYPESIIMEMNSIMREWMEGFFLSEDNFYPQHGPGAVAEQSARQTQLKKYSYLGTDTLINYVFRKFAGLDVTTYYPFPPTRWSRISKLVFVPKSMKTRRSISKEPTTLMFLQQGVQTALRNFIAKHSFLRNHIDFERQEKNAQLAISASATQKFATIDLSSASDTVTTQLVKAVFRGTTLYPYLVALRSNSVELPSGKVLSTAKFAPMGSALCFPIETLIFACAVEYAVRRARRTHLGFFPVWRVYGDDIIVEDALYGDVTLVLEALGFILNPSKSFSSPARFRESCGGEGYDGVDVTPMKISRRFISIRGRVTSHRAADYLGLIDMANQCYIYQFSLLRIWIIRALLDNPIAPPLFSRLPDGAIYSPWPDNFRARRRYHKGYQRLEIEVVGSRSRSLKKDHDPATEQARYYETLRLSSRRNSAPLDDMFRPEHRISVPSGSDRPRLRKVWVERPEL